MLYFQYYLLVATSGLHDIFTVESDVLRSNCYGATCPSFNSDVLLKWEPNLLRDEENRCHKTRMPKVRY